MERRSVTHGTFVIERSYPASPERVFAALSTPELKRRWFVENRGMTTEKFEMDFRIGGRETTSSRFKEGSRFPGVVMTNETTYLDIVPGRRVALAYTMALGDKRISASLATFELMPAGECTDLIFTEQGAYFEGADGAQMREEGWRKLLESLAVALAR